MHVPTQPPIVSSLTPPPFTAAALPHLRDQARLAARKFGEGGMRCKGYSRGRTQRDGKSNGQEGVYSVRRMTRTKP